MPNDDIPLVGDMPFELTTFLEGRTRARGVFEDRFGKLRRRFRVEMDGRWQNGVFILDERFDYDTGQSETRTWRVVPGLRNSFTATCDDCIGQAQGVCDNESIRMHYRFRLKMQDRTLIVDLEDRIYRMGSGVAVNRATMSKWGVRLGELSLFFSKANSGDANIPPNRAAA
jgi:hypothetical protein